MTKNEAKQRVLDAVADLAQVELDVDSRDRYVAFLHEVEDAVVERVEALARQSYEPPDGFTVIHNDGTAARVEFRATDDAVAAADMNLRAAERAEGRDDGECCECVHREVDPDLPPCDRCIGERPHMNFRRA